MGYGVGTTSHSASKTSDADTSILAKDQKMKFSTTYQEFRIIDTTGILLAAFVNASRQSAAREDALEKAAAEGRPRNDDGTVTVEYSYEPMPILAGLLTDMRFRIPLGTVDGEIPSGTDAKTGSTGYWGLSLRPEFYTFRPVKSLPLVASLWFDAEFEIFHGKTQDDIEDADLDEIDMGFGTSVSYVVRENVTATGRLGLGVLSPLFGAIDGGSKFNPYGELEVAYRPWHAGKYGFQVGATAAGGKAHATERSATYTRFGLNVAVTFGDQVREHTRTQQTPTAPGEVEHLDSNALILSGNICVGKRVPDSCKVIDELPSDAKTVYVLCAQATQDALDKNDWSKQPAICREAATLSYNAAGETNRSDNERKKLYIAAATLFDFAGAGYEATGGHLGVDHCAMVEATFTAVKGDGTHASLPTKLTYADEAVQVCRAKHYTCGPDPKLGVVCTAAVIEPSPPEAPAPTPAGPATQ
ncbi:MAG TPA: hypothetical protein VGM39_26430 [Kofleriaceae bacterium]